MKGERSELSELARLGLRRQRYGVIELYGEPDPRD